ncbi:PI-PLC domain-containing protein [Zymomonas mobilis]|uniref:Glycerophosphoryl diester phosphodiesterase n=1 Tax=Zymomonas mobilis subsp. pomaceae (strain ATCC 29192 / DSM 22645 / JCM 10191 / CCUG 17912 / NBRC 13757 / NCIMB 11200 / NRRL B-4491 / Barker I) TaxID=579138 RepID=F8ETD9_ZYMMT|nr:hypothetical protein [Zymomonas mobilis]AEI37964.1 conserved hypothetical protein [Zymomonas mobilis subsp. pomaceae ATCC 29192]MDX5949332.1 hypothetical protein [Zymomonas mobilis subsp. pomaceae]GEB89661.1 hypothetical protein ZMO02_12980 [Zymomonas mobilis subsp. pomaceae]
MIYLAHRGLWTVAEERNTPEAFRRAFKAGYGVELDLRDQNGCIVISHDPPTGECQPFIDVVKDYVAAGMPGKIAINIKADGLQNMLADVFKDVPGLSQHCFVFDMSLPDFIGYLKYPFVAFSRYSEFETRIAFDNETTGIWYDSFMQPWIDPAFLISELKRGKLVAIVSPELHQRQEYEIFWELLANQILKEHLPPAFVAERLMLCTDFPDKANNFFKQAGL